jgi:hypothetical protein
MPPAVIAAGIMGGTSLAGSFMNRGNKKMEQQAMQGQQQIANRQSALANTISGFARQQHTMAQPAINKAMEYYMSVVGSAGQGAMTQAMAPQVAALNAQYGGAERGLMARMGPGAQRDSAVADLYKQRVGQQGMAGINARQNAVGALADMGQNVGQCSISPRWSSDDLRSECSDGFATWATE